MKKVQKEGKEDELLILFVAILTLAGLFFLYSTGTYNGKVKFGDAGYYLKKQLFASVLGMIAFFGDGTDRLSSGGGFCHGTVSVFHRVVYGCFICRKIL